MFLELGALDTVYLHNGIYQFATLKTNVITSAQTVEKRANRGIKKNPAVSVSRSWSTSWMVITTRDLSIIKQILNVTEVNVTEKEVQL